MTTPTMPSPAPARATPLDKTQPRLNLSVSGQGWSADLTNQLASVAFGESLKVPVYVSHVKGASASAEIKLEARSESDPSVVVSATWIYKDH